MPRLMHHALVVVRTDLASPFRDRFSFDRSVKVFAAADASEVLAKIQKQAPLCIALDRKFVTSPAGAQFVTELRSAHPDFEVRILTDEGGDIPLVLRRPVQATGLKTVEACSEPLVGEFRRAPRFPVTPGCEAAVNGQRAALVDVSVSGAQVLSPVVLRPAQAVRVALVDDTPISADAAVVWSMFERSKKTGQLHYRVGMQFTRAEQRLIEAYCTKYGIKT